MQNLPNISIIVPNYNGGKTLGATLQSLLDQDYPHLEIIVCDGASKDDSVEIIKSFETHLKWWVSEKDGGPIPAINKGFTHAAGEVVNWLGSDDRLKPGALLAVGKFFAANPGADVLVGRSETYFEAGGHIVVDNPSPARLSELPVKCPIMQPSCFFRRSAVKRPTVLNENYNIIFDMELWCYLKTQKVSWAFTGEILSQATIGGENLSYQAHAKIRADAVRLYKEYSTDWVPVIFFHKYLFDPLRRWRMRKPTKFRFHVAKMVRAALFLFIGPLYGYSRVRTLEWVGNI